MTTPSQNVYRPVLTQVETDTWTTRRDGPPYNFDHYTSSPIHIGNDVLERPASTTSPVRADGTRAPKPWDTTWGMYRQGLRGATWYRPSGIYKSYFSVTDSPLVGYTGLSHYLSACGAGWSRTDPSEGFPYTAEALARTAFRKELLDGKADWGVTLGEMRETVRGIRTYCEDVLTLIEYLGKKAKASKRAVVETILGVPPRSRRTPPWYRGKDRLIIDHWLAYQFAAKPLLGDIQTSGEALSWLYFDEAKPLRFKLKKGGSAVSEHQVNVPGYNWQPSYEGTVPLERAEQCHISCVYDAAKTGTRTLQQLGLTNPLSVAWELTTLSWGVDYISNMGDWIQSLAKIDGGDFVEGSLTRVQRVRSVGPMSVRPHPAVKHYLGSLSDLMFVLNAGRMQRIVLSSTPTPALRPAFRNRLGLTRVANLTAVLSNLLR